jgi:Na+-translocating ferredoxin:NAD+ oxidoreductase RnfD subunit
MPSISTPMLSTRPLVRFLRTPKGLLLIIFVGLLAISSLKLGTNVVTSKVVVAAVTAAAIDMAVTYWLQGDWILPDGAVLTGMIVAFVLRPQETWFVLLLTVAVAILSKHALRTRWSNILNPAAFALVVAAILLHTGQSWWGALPDLGMIGVGVLLVVGAFIADRLNKLPMVLTFFAAYFALFTLASFFDSNTVAETFRTPDLQAALFFAFFMLDDPPTSPVRYEDQVVFGMIVATVAYVVFTQFGGVYYLPAGLLAGNIWESGRRVVFSRLRTWRSAAAARAASFSASR